MTCILGSLRRLVEARVDTFFGAEIFVNPEKAAYSAIEAQSSGQICLGRRRAALALSMISGGTKLQIKRARSPTLTQILS